MSDEEKSDDEQENEEESEEIEESEEQEDEEESEECDDHQEDEEDSDDEEDDLSGELVFENGELEDDDDDMEYGECDEYETEEALFYGYEGELQRKNRKLLRALWPIRRDKPNNLSSWICREAVNGRYFTKCPKCGTRLEFCCHPDCPTLLLNTCNCKGEEIDKEDLVVMGEREVIGKAVMCKTFEQAREQSYDECCKSFCYRHAQKYLHTCSLCCVETEKHKGKFCSDCMETCYPRPTLHRCMICSTIFCKDCIRDQCDSNCKERRFKRRRSRYSSSLD